MKTAKFEVFQAPDGWRWRLRSKNGEIVAQSESYTTKAGAKRAAQAVFRAMTTAEIIVKD